MVGSEPMAKLVGPLSTLAVIVLVFLFPALIAAAAIAISVLAAAGFVYGLLHMIVKS